MMVRSRLQSFVLVLLYFMAIAPVAWAQEEPPVVKALYDTFAEVGGERPTHQSLTTAADGTITITGVKILMQNMQQDGQDIRQELVADELIMGGVKDASKGIFEVGTMSMKNAVISVTTPDVETVRMTMPVMQAEGAFIRSPDMLKTGLDRMFAQSMMARSYTVPLLTMAIGDFSIDLHDLKFKWDGDPKTFMGESVYSIGSVELPASTLDDLGMTPSLKELGYDKLVFAATGRANMQMPKEHIEVEGDSSFLARDMGAFSTSGAVGGMQPALFEAAQAIQESPNSIDVNAMMAMLQTVTIGHVKLRYDDASLAEKLLTWVTQSEGKSREQIVTEAAALSDFSLAGLGSPELSAQAKAAIQTFLTKPGWIQIELRPDAPIAVNKVMPLLGTPAEIVKLFKLQISAGALGE
ncbi:MAG: hypothetical protein HKN11_03135 [Rhizobiales bacterium]|nr:hypothetical protein [Hyphomicrobiales bacterium]